MFQDLPTLRRRRSTKWVEHPPDVLPAFVAEMDVALAPPIRDALVEAIELGDAGYAEPAGLFEAFAGFAQRRFGWAPDPSRMVLVPDVMAGIVELLRVLTEPGDGVVITPPVYPPFFEGIPEAGRRVVEVPLAGDALDLDAIDAALAAGARALLLCNPHNPTGRVLDRATLEAVAALAERRGALVLSDEIHAPLTLPGARHTPGGWPSCSPASSPRSATAHRRRASSPGSTAASSGSARTRRPRSCATAASRSSPARASAGPGAASRA